MDLPPIIVVPVGIESRLCEEECQRIAKQIRNADEGDVLVLPFEADIFTLVDGYWLPVQDLAAFHSAPDVPVKREPGETAGGPVED